MKTKTNLTPEQIIAQFSGRGGGEDETNLNDFIGDKAYVTVYSTTSAAARIAKRSPSAIISAMADGDGVILKIARSRFRGVEYAIKPD